MSVFREPPHGDAPRGGAPARSGTVMVALRDVTCRIRDHLLLEHTTWEIRRGEHWVVLGPNGSGKSTLVRTLAGRLPTARGERVLQPGVRPGLVSFEEQRTLLLRELEWDHARHYAGTTDTVQTPRVLLAGATAPRARDKKITLDIPQLEPLLDRPLRHLSAGEMRTVLIAASLAASPDLLVLDEPFDGLDSAARAFLAQLLETLAEQGTQIILATHRREEVPSFATHALTVQAGRVLRQGPVAAVLTRDHLQELYSLPSSRRAITQQPPRNSATDATPEATRTPAGHPADTRTPAPPLVSFRRATVRQGERVLLRDLTWDIRRGEHWILTGPNGSGKTTLVNLIRGEEQQGYAINLSLFGQRRGSGESIWELRHRIGVVTPQVQVTYHGHTTVQEAVISGYSGSVGLYRRPADHEVRDAQHAMEYLGIRALEHRQVRTLSYGQLRLVMIARALVHRPDLLLLDEPCQGLDPSNREMVVQAVETLCSEDSSSTVVYISHHDDELPASIQRRLTIHGDGHGSWSDAAPAPPAPASRPARPPGLPAQ